MYESIIRTNHCLFFRPRSIGVLTVFKGTWCLLQVHYPAVVCVFFTHLAIVVIASYCKLCLN